MSNQLPDADILAMMVSETVFQLFGFGPSQDICKPFARRVIAEANPYRYIQLDEIPTEADS